MQIHTKRIFDNDYNYTISYFNLMITVLAEMYVVMKHFETL